MLNYPFECTKYSGAVFSHPAFSGWSFYAGVRCSANASIIQASCSYPYYGSQGAGANAALAHLNEGTVEFSSTLASTYNSGASAVTGSLSITIWDRLTITSSNAQIYTNGAWQTVISGLNIYSSLGAPKSFSVKASSSELVIVAGGVEKRAVYEPLEGMTNNISFNVMCDAAYNGVNFATNAALYTPGEIKITT